MSLHKSTFQAERNGRGTVILEYFISIEGRTNGHGSLAFEIRRVKKDGQMSTLALHQMVGLVGAYCYAQWCDSVSNCEGAKLIRRGWRMHRGDGLSICMLTGPFLRLQLTTAHGLRTGLQIRLLLLLLLLLWLLLSLLLFPLLRFPSACRKYDTFLIGTHQSDLEVVIMPRQLLN